MKKFVKLSIFFSALTLAGQAYAAPLSIEQQGSFAVGGSVKTSEGTYNPTPDVVKGKESNNFMDVYAASIQTGGRRNQSHTGRSILVCPIPYRHLPEFQSRRCVPTRRTVA